MSLFNQLLRLYGDTKPTEDFLTEIFAYCLLVELEILEEFLIFFDITKQVDKEYSLRTQVFLKKLPAYQQQTDSKPDMVLSSNTSIIFFENKVGADEQEDQLPRYAEQLDNITGIEERVLIYITRDFDPKNETAILEKCKRPIKFIQLRWYQIYLFLKKYTDHSIIKELLFFMNKNNLSSNNQFSPLNILALNNFSNSIKMMDNVLDAIIPKFHLLVGKEKTGNPRMESLKEKERYTVHSKNNGIWINMGFYFNTPDYPNYPVLRFDFQEQANNTKKPGLVKVLQTIDQTGNKDMKWKGYNLKPSVKFTGIRLEKSMQDFLHQEDHIIPMQAYFMQCLEEYEKIKPQLEPFL